MPNSDAHYERVEFVFIVQDLEDLPDFKVLRETLKEVFPSVKEIEFGSSIDVVNVLVGLLLESRKLFGKSQKESLEKYYAWARERDQILNSLSLNT